MNPQIIQTGGPPGAAPLVLIHDGSGNCAHYLRLGSLQRRVYGIHSPRARWKGGISEMADVYAELVRTVVPRGPLLLGGWSLGGIVAIEVALRLQQDPAIHVRGIVMLDSVFPHRDPLDTRPVVQHLPKFAAGCPLELQRAVRRSMALSAAMLDSWYPSARIQPAGDYFSFRERRGNSVETPPLTHTQTTPTSPDDLATPHSMGGPVQAPEKRPPQPAVPPAILLRATDHFPTPEMHLSRVDIHRSDLLLGWGRYNQSLIHAVLDLPGHHFNLFDQDHVDYTTHELSLACQMLEIGTH